MRAWTRAVVDVRCGLCTDRIPAGEPLLRISLPALKRPLWRCDRCAGPAPPDLPARIETCDRPALDMAPLKALAQTVALDFKARASGDA